MEDVIPSRLITRACRLFEALKDAGIERDRAGNRELRYSHYAALHLLALFHLAITSDPGTDERDALTDRLEPGCVYVADRGYERYARFNAIVGTGSDYVIRVQDRPHVVVTARPLGRGSRPE